MRQATLEDLYKEAWLRMREKGYIVWTTREGKQISIKDMSDTHLVNTINMLERNKAAEEQRQAEIDEIMDHMGEMDPLEYYD